MSNRCLVIGTGPMGQDHIRSLLGLQVDCAAFAPSDKNQSAIRSLEVPFFSGQLARTISSFKPTHVIVSSPVEILSKISCEVLSLGVRNLLIEKPAYLDQKQALEILKLKREQPNSEVFVAYNRRFYNSVLMAENAIRTNGESLQNILFEFTEWSHQIEELSAIKSEVKTHWALANSAHVIDTAFLLSGLPASDRSQFLQKGSIDWHPTGQIFIGSGYTRSDIPFAYHANWTSAGRWSIEWITNVNRYIFRPMEQLRIVAKGSVAETIIDPSDDLDKKFKPGLFRQNRAFIFDEDRNRLMRLSESIDFSKTVCDIAGYQF